MLKNIKEINPESLTLWQESFEFRQKFLFDKTVHELAEEIPVLKNFDAYKLVRF